MGPAWSVADGDPDERTIVPAIRQALVRLSGLLWGEQCETRPVPRGGPADSTSHHKEPGMSELPFFRDGEESHAMALLQTTAAVVDSDASVAARRQATRAREEAAGAHQALAAARRVRGYPAGPLAALERQAELATEQRAKLVEELRTKANRKARAVEARYTAAVTAALARPPGLDATADELQQQELRRRLEGMAEPERVGMLRTAVQDPNHRPLVRAALSAPSGPWATTSWPRLIDQTTAKQLSEILAARVDRSLVEDVWTVRRLRQIAEDLEVTQWQPAGRRGALGPSPALRDGPGGHVKVLADD
jgi:hypothetical protein